MRRTTAIVVLLLATSACLAGCGGGTGGATPREKSMQTTMEGSYQVKGIEDGKTQGVGIYDNGSFRIIMEDTSRIVIYNRETEEGWLVNLSAGTYEAISYDEAVMKAGFMPELVMTPYFGLEQFWEGPEFRMDTADGRSIRAYLEGPEYLPSAWIAESQGKIIKEIGWEYRRLGQVSAANFLPPEGLTLRE